MHAEDVTNKKEKKSQRVSVDGLCSKLQMFIQNVRSKLEQYRLKDAQVLHEFCPCGCSPYTMVYLIQHLELK